MVDTATRFWSHVAVSARCWEWTGSRNPDGYGSFTVDGRSLKAHRVAWELTHGPIPRGDGPHGTCVCHRCDNPACVRPDHLFLGSNRDNMRDRQAKGRTKNLELGPQVNRAKTHCVNGHLRDERNMGVRADGQRWCRACARERSAQRRAARRAIAW